MLAKGMIESEPRRARDQRLIRQISGELSITVRSTRIGNLLG